MSRRRLEDISEEELKRIERESGWLMEIFYKGGIFPMKVLRRFDEETKETRIKAVKACNISRSPSPEMTGRDWGREKEGMRVDHQQSEDRLLGNPEQTDIKSI